MLNKCCLNGPVPTGMVLIGKDGWFRKVLTLIVIHTPGEFLTLFPPPTLHVVPRKGVFAVCGHNSSNT